MLFRLIGDKDHCRIFGVYYGEYLYAADKKIDEERRRVYSWIPGGPVNNGDWKISLGSIRNINHNENMYADDMATRSFWNPLNVLLVINPMRPMWTWRPYSQVQKGFWTVIDVSFEKDDLNTPF